MANEVKKDEPKSWLERTALEISELAAKEPTAPADLILTPELALTFLEAAGEMKAIRAKVLLGKCWAFLKAVDATGEALTSPDGLLDAIEAELK